MSAVNNDNTTVMVRATAFEEGIQAQQNLHKGSGDYRTPLPYLFVQFPLISVKQFTLLKSGVYCA